MESGLSKSTYDPVPEKIFVHDNAMSNNAYAGGTATRLAPVSLPAGGVRPPRRARS